MVRPPQYGRPALLALIGLALPPVLIWSTALVYSFSVDRSKRLLRGIPLPVNWTG